MESARVNDFRVLALDSNEDDDDVTGIDVFVTEMLDDCDVCSHS